MAKTYIRMRLEAEFYYRTNMHRTVACGHLLSQVRQLKMFQCEKHLKLALNGDYCVKHFIVLTSIEI